MRKWDDMPLWEAYADLIKTFKIDELVVFSRKFNRDALVVDKCKECNEPFYHHDRASCWPIYKRERNNEP